MQCKPVSLNIYGAIVCVCVFWPVFLRATRKALIVPKSPWCGLAMDQNKINKKRVFIDKPSYINEFKKKIRTKAMRVMDSHVVWTFPHPLLP